METFVREVDRKNIRWSHLLAHAWMKGTCVEAGEDPDDYVWVSQGWMKLPGLRGAALRADRIVLFEYVEPAHSFVSWGGNAGGLAYHADHVSAVIWLCTYPGGEQEVLIYNRPSQESEEAWFTYVPLLDLESFPISRDPLLVSFYLKDTDAFLEQPWTGTGW